MSLVSGLPFRYIPFLVNQQPSGPWVGNNTVFTTINRGNYLISWNPRVLPFLGGGDTVNSYQFAIVSNAPFGNIGSVVLVCSPNFGLAGQTAGNSVGVNLNNIVYIPNDNTSIYLYINVTTTNAGGWVANTDTYLKYLLPPQFTLLF